MYFWWIKLVSLEKFDIVYELWNCTLGSYWAYLNTRSYKLWSCFNNISKSMKNLPKSSNMIPTYILNHVITHNYDNHDILLKLLVSQINVNYSNFRLSLFQLISVVSVYFQFKDNKNSLPIHEEFQLWMEIRVVTAVW